MTLESIARFLNGLPSAEFFSSAAFWAYFAIVAVSLRVLPRRGVVGDLLLLVANLVMLLALPSFNGVALLMYFVLAGFTFCVGHTLNSGLLSRNRRGRIALATFGIGAVLFTLAVFKYHHLQNLMIRDKSLFGGGATDFVFLIGISYTSFKAMHVIIESYKQTLKSLRPLSFLNYLLFFPSFVSGPINRYNHFCENSPAATKSRFRDDVYPGLERIIHGLFKKFVIAVILFPYTVIGTKVPLGEMAPWQILLCLYVYALYFYVDFSGYTDLAIGSARLLGFSLPENFNLPFLKKNLQQAWANWHMSLTGWLTDYVYWPLVRKLRSIETLRKYPLVVSNLAIIVTFLLCGAWHGPTFHFILWGLYHGIGIAAVNVYQKWKRQVRHPAALTYFASPLSYGLGIALSFNYFALGLVVLLDTGELVMLFERFFWAV